LEVVVETAFGIIPASEGFPPFGVEDAFALERWHDDTTAMGTPGFYWPVFVLTALAIFGLGV
jgi:hypothetical protein